MRPEQVAWTVSNWNAYVEAGMTREERARRLAEVPANLRTEVEAHVRCAFAIRGAVHVAGRQRAQRAALGDGAPREGEG